MQINIWKDNIITLTIGCASSIIYIVYIFIHSIHCLVHNVKYKSHITFSIIELQTNQRTHLSYLEEKSEDIQ